MRLTHFGAMLLKITLWAVIALTVPCHAQSQQPHYFVGQTLVEMSISPQWWLVEADSLDPEQLRKNIRWGALEQTEPLIPLRYAVKFASTMNRSDQIETLSSLKKRGLIRRSWPAFERFGGVGFFDDQFVFRVSGKPDWALLKNLGLTDPRPTPISGIWTGKSAAGDAVSTANRIRNRGGLGWAEPDLIRHVGFNMTPNDRNFGDQWHLEADDDIGDIDVTAAWDVTFGHPDIVIAVFDNGFDLEHPDLEPNIIGGFDAVDGGDNPSAPCIETPDGAGPSGSCPRNRPYRASHGTAVAGVAAARGNNRTLGAGVCPMCGLYPVRLLSGGAVRAVTTATALNQAERAGAAVINNSWGPSLTRFFPLAQAEKEVLNRITKEGRDGKGVVVIFAAGNDYFTPATVNPYASHPDVIAVAASTRIDDFACYSNYGPVISVAAPSKGCNRREPGLQTTDVRGFEGYNSTDFTTDFGGTSAAAPVVAGLAGLILSANPDLTAQQVRIVLEQTAAKINADKNDWQEVIGADLAELFAYDKYGFSRGFGYGRVNADSAVNAAVNDPPDIGASCSKGCGACIDDRCAPACSTDRDCPTSSQCQPTESGGRACILTRPSQRRPGQRCNDDCEICVEAPDSDLRLVSICTEACTSDNDCEFGFDCRPLGPDQPKVCVPGNQECGSPWGSTRCQSSVIVEGNGELFCSCECIPNQPGACPDGFKCSNVLCQRQRGVLSCVAVEQVLEANYPPQCVPDPDVKRPCQDHQDCSSGLFCIDNVCSPDREDGGCDTCTMCQTDADCAAGSNCIDTPRGLRCMQPCSSRDEVPCRGTMACTNIPGPPGFHCVNPDFDRKGICPRAWRCELEGRCFSDNDCSDETPCVDRQCLNDAVDSEILSDQGSFDGDAGADAHAGQETSVVIIESTERRAGGRGCALSSDGGSSSLWFLLLPVGVLTARRSRLNV
ncbi:MAG: S8 family serine peptidase [Myxococcota bacterium]|nr:S8 family serine peptidase [Myxococcota bacterium]